MELDDLPSYVFVIVFLVMVIVGFLPKVPVWVKIPLQLIVGGVIDNQFGGATFNLPFGDHLETSTLYGGKNEYSPGFNFLSVGFISTVLGLVCSLLSFGIGKLRSKGSKAEE